MSLSTQLDIKIDTLNEPSIFKNTSFLFLWMTIFASSLSVSFFMFAINWYIVDYLKLDAMLGVVLVASTVPRLLFMLIGGVIADRMSKAKVMFISDVTKGILLIGIVCLFLFDVLSIWSLVVLGFLFGVLDAFFWPASNSILMKWIVIIPILVIIFLVIRYFMVK
jgi:MFS family permease